ncbi:MAG: 2Fe-2S iron-sulfur cluster binding domain-containing protein [Bacteroidetes bacterium]|nr:2Fe-2S iron-sulfur cluster binding domain-containing protein [Bacteroidota bacterium]
MSDINKIKVVLDDETHELELEEGQTILDAAIEADIDPPYACQAAACCTCRAKVMEGSVKMDDDDMLTDWEIDEGYILTCQSHPSSEGVVVSFDEE